MTALMRWVAVVLGVVGITCTVFYLLVSLSQPDDTPETTLIYRYLLQEPFIHLPNVAFLSMHERRHLLDVKKQLQRVRDLGLVCDIAFLLTLFLLRQQVAVVLRRVGQLGFTLSLSIGLLSLIWFHQLFAWVHLFLFKPNTWIFNQTTWLAKIFPVAFFESFLTILLVCFTVLFLLFIGIFSVKQGNHTHVYQTSLIMRAKSRFF